MGIQTYYQSKGIPEGSKGPDISVTGFLTMIVSLFWAIEDALKVERSIVGNLISLRVLNCGLSQI